VTGQRSAAMTLDLSHGSQRRARSGDLACRGQRALASPDGGELDHGADGPAGITGIGLGAGAADEIRDRYLAGRIIQREGAAYVLEAAGFLQVPERLSDRLP
jgi:hypothetical protein